MDNRLKSFLFWTIFALLSLFFISFENLHNDINLSIEDSCPICIFEKNVVFYVDFNLILSFFIVLLVLLYRLFFREDRDRILHYFHPSGQRAPPQFQFSG